MTANAVSILNPVAQTMADLILPSELQEIRELARAASLDPVDEVKRVFGCAPEVLNRVLVPDVLEWLRAKGSEIL